MKKNYGVKAFIVFWLAAGIFWISLGSALGQSCGCDHVITPSLSPAFWGNNSKKPALPGQTICLMAGTYKFFRFYNVQGTATQPIKIKNCGGAVVINSDTLPSGSTSGIGFSNCKYVQFTGTGDAQWERGIRVTKAASGAGVSIGGLSTNFEVDHLDVSGCYFSGIMAKTDPGCDSTTWRDNFTMYDVSIHDNYVHDLFGGEGVYAGNSFWGTGMMRVCSGDTIYALPHRIMGLHIYNNRFERTASEGIQVGCAPDALVHDNVIIDAGVAPFANYQANGLQIGGGAGGNYYSNVILNTRSVAMTIVGYLGDVSIYNNLIVGSGSGVDALFLDDRPGTLPGTYVRIMNNTIINPGRDAIRMYSEINDHYIYNNALINPASGRYITRLNTNVPFVAQNNYQGTLAGAGFVDPINYDYHLTSTSPLKDAGLNLDSLGVTTDLEYLPRPQGSGFDIGAYEYTSLPLRRRTNSLISSAITAVGNQVLRTGTESEGVRVTVSPNPARAEVTCRVSTGTIQELNVLNAQAKSVLHRQYRTPQASTRFSVAALPAGVYVIRVRTEAGIRTARLVRQ
jgi:hypothetical protein